MDSCQPEVYLGGLYVSRNRKILLRYNYTHLYSNLTLRISSSLTNNVFLFIHASFQENASLGTNFFCTIVIKATKNFLHHFMTPINKLIKHEWNLWTSLYNTKTNLNSFLRIWVSHFGYLIYFDNLFNFKFLEFR